MASEPTVLHASTVFTGRHVFSPGSIAFRDGKVLAVGNRRDVLAACGAGAHETDFGRATICSGFHDAHLHFFHSALYGSDLAESYLGESEADCVARLAPLAARRPDGWLLAQGWREYRWNPARTPSRDSLDAAFPHRPVAMYSGDAHTLWLNSCAMRELGIREDSVACPGGSFDRDASGRLTGIVREAAAMELMPRIVESFSAEELAGAYRGFMGRLAAKGITSVCDMSLMAQPGLDFVHDELFGMLDDAGALGVRVHMFPTLLGSMERLEQMQARYRGGRLRACGFKQFFDGVSSQHTAWLTDPYANARVPGECGRPTIDPARMRALVMDAARAGHAVRVHAIGDAAIHAALDIFEEAIAEFGQPSRGRHAIEHLENFLPDDIARLAALGVVASVQPEHITLDPGGPERDLGCERAALMWPFATLLKTGCTLAFGSDSPVVDPDPLKTLYTAVTRQDAATHEPCGGWLPSERIGMREALLAATLGGAVACGREREIGLLEPGYLADACVLDCDVFSEEVARTPEALLSAHVLATYLDGEPIFVR